MAIPFGSAGIPNTYIPNADQPCTYWDVTPTSRSLNGAAHALALGGYVEWEDYGTHNIAAVGWRNGTNTVGTSTMRVSLQDKALATPVTPDLVVDQSWTGAVPASNQWNVSTFTAARSSVAHGSKLCVVWDFTVYSGASILRVQLPQTAVAQEDAANGFSITTDKLTWGGIIQVSNVILISDDTPPKFGRIGHCWPQKATNTHTFNNASNPKAHALSITLNAGAVVTQFWMYGGTTVTSDFALSSRRLTNGLSW